MPAKNKTGHDELVAEGILKRSGILKIGESKYCPKCQAVVYISDAVSVK